MKELFKKIIISKQEWLKTIVPINRNLVIEKEMNYAFTGLRRAGKSFYLYQIIQQLNKINKLEEILFINFEDERLLEVTYKDLHLIIEAYKELFDHQPIVFLDEIQNIQHWQKFVRRLTDEGYKIYITGSNAEMLSHEIGTILGGRFINKEILPLSFPEFLKFNEITVSKQAFYSNEKIKIKKAFENYLIQGGFPELLKIDRKQDYLSSVYQKLFYGDLIARYKISNITILKLLVKKIAESVNNETSVNRIKNLIKSTGTSIGSNTLFEYLIYLEQSYLIGTISNFYRKFSEKETNKKYYFLDNGILGLFLFDQNTKLLENLIYIELRRRGFKTYFVKRTVEIDFYVPEENLLIQSAYSIANPETRTREIKAIKKGMIEFQINESFIITYDEDEKIEIEEGIIHVIPAWKWLLMEKQETE